MHPALGIDMGHARIGIAATDPCGILSHPVESIHLERTEPLARIAQLVEQRGIRTFVLGLPLRGDGSEGAACEYVREFGQKLRVKFPEIPLVYVDEYCTTVEAAKKLHEAGKRAKDFKPIIDQAAAVEILNIWLQQVSPPPPDDFFEPPY